MNHRIIVDARWEPGDPLYRRPRGSGAEEQTVRPIFELRDQVCDLDHLDETIFRICRTCLIAWAGWDESRKCWVCGKECP